MDGGFLYMSFRLYDCLGFLLIVYWIIIQTMVFAAVFAANFFNGLNTSVWTGWVFFAVFIGDILLWVYTVCGLMLDFWKLDLISDIGSLQCDSPFIGCDMGMGQ